MAKELNVPVECQRFWLWAKRQNHTYRPNRPLTDQEEAQTVITATLTAVIRTFLLVNVFLFVVLNFPLEEFIADLGHFVFSLSETEVRRLWH